MKTLFLLQLVAILLYSLHSHLDYTKRGAVWINYSYDVLSVNSVMYLYQSCARWEWKKPPTVNSGLIKDIQVRPSWRQTVREKCERFSVQRLIWRKPACLCYLQLCKWANLALYLSPSCALCVPVCVRAKFSIQLKKKRKKAYIEWNVFWRCFITKDIMHHMHAQQGVY